MAGRTVSKPYRHPLIGLTSVIVLGLLAAFFAWQAAEPLWLAVGRGEDGSATVTRCDPTDGAPVGGAPTGGAPVDTDQPGATYQCVAFEAASGAFRAVDVNLFGAGEAARTDGTTLPAQMLSAERGQAYAVTGAGLHLRWSLGLVLVLACGAGIAWASGATRLERPRARGIAVLVSFAGPLLLATGFLAAAY